jgi:hypothetical protein
MGIVVSFLGLRLFTTELGQRIASYKALPDAPLRMPSTAQWQLADGHCER